MQSLDFSLTQVDLDLTTEFMMLLADEGKEYFNSDDFRRYRLHERMVDPAHDIGVYFSKLKANGVAEYVGEVPSEVLSNNRRKVDLWRWNWRVWRGLLAGRLENYVVKERNGKEA